MSDETIPLPHPENPEHTDNLNTLPRLEAQSFEGIDNSLGESLFGYDLIWRTLPGSDAGTLFIYRVAGDKDPEKRFDRSVLSSATDLRQEFNWIKPSGWEAFFNTQDTTREAWDQLPFGCRIFDLVNHYGYENIFGSCNWEGFLIRDPAHDYGANPAPGETPEDYKSRLLFGDDRGDAVICRDFIRDEDKVWFVSGGGQCFGSQLHQWHNNCDAIYAAGSQVAANRGVPLGVLGDAIDLLQQCAERCDDPFSRAHGEALVAVMQAALEAEPSEQAQEYEGRSLTE